MLRRAHQVAEPEKNHATSPETAVDGEPKSARILLSCAIGQDLGASSCASSL